MEALCAKHCAHAKFCRWCPCEALPAFHDVRLIHGKNELADNDAVEVVLTPVVLKYLPRKAARRPCRPNAREGVSPGGIYHGRLVLVCCCYLFGNSVRNCYHALHFLCPATGYQWQFEYFDLLCDLLWYLCAQLFPCSP